MAQTAVLQRKSWERSIDGPCLEHYVDWTGKACDGISAAYVCEHGVALPSIGGALDRAGNF